MICKKSMKYWAHPPLLYRAIKTFLYLVVVTPMLSFNVLGQGVSGKWANPILIEGSDFGRVFQAYYKTGNIMTLLSLTSQETRIEYGDSLIQKYYARMQFGFYIELIAHRSTSRYEYLLIYKANIMSTNYILKMNVIVENDTSKVKLPIDFVKHKYFLIE